MTDTRPRHLYRLSNGRHVTAATITMAQIDELHAAGLINDHQRKVAGMHGTLGLNKEVEYVLRKCAAACNSHRNPTDP